MCAGVVKASPLHSKNPAQHAHDLEALKQNEKVSSAFLNPESSKPKSKVCVRVDGGNDEGPGHEEVQFWWTRYHLQESSVSLTVTTRDSGSSSKNRVELQNGCLALGHTNLFIPSTLNGSCIDSSTGNVNQEKLKENLSDAIDVYINRTDKCSCGNMVIHLFKGTDSSEYQRLREMVRVYLKGRVAAKKKLKSDNPEEFKMIDSIWQLRKRHLTPNRHLTPKGDVCNRVWLHFLI